MTSDTMLRAKRKKKQEKKYCILIIVVVPIFMCGGKEISFENNIGFQVREHSGAFLCRWKLVNSTLDTFEPQFPSC